jgi:hypothetical protein
MRYKMPDDFFVEPAAEKERAVCLLEGKSQLNSRITIMG